jgi:hypothetical protein
MKMKVLKLMFFVTNLILRFFCGACCDHGKERSVSKNLESQALYGVHTCILGFSNYGEGCGRACIGFTVYQM